MSEGRVQGLQIGGLGLARTHRFQGLMVKSQAQGRVQGAHKFPGQEGRVFGTGQGGREMGRVPTGLAPQPGRRLKITGILRHCQGEKSLAHPIAPVGRIVVARVGNHRQAQGRDQVQNVPARGEQHGPQEAAVRIDGRHAAEGRPAHAPEKPHELIRCQVVELVPQADPDLGPSLAQVVEKSLPGLASGLLDAPAALPGQCGHVHAAHGAGNTPFAAAGCGQGGLVAGFGTQGMVEVGGFQTGAQTRSERPQ